MNRVLTLTTDFGRQDGYVGALKGTLVSLAPDATLIDISHDIPPQDVLAGAICLLQAARHFPADAIHLVVVDPEVGSERAGLAVAAWGQWFVGPDSGVLHFPLASPGRRAYQLRRPEIPSAATTTFDGRDWFAPAAAALAGGADIASLGAPTDDVAMLNLPAPTFEDFRWVGHVLHIDHYGNVISDLPPPPVEARAKARVFVGDHPIGPIRASYAAVAVGKAVATIGALQTVEAGLNRDHGQRRWSARRGQKFEILFPERVATPRFPAWEPSTPVERRPSLTASSN